MTLKGGGAIYLHVLCYQANHTVFTVTDTFTAINSQITGVEGTIISDQWDLHNTSVKMSKFTAICESLSLDSLSKIATDGGSAMWWATGPGAGLFFGSCTTGGSYGGMRLSA